MSGISAHQPVMAGPTPRRNNFSDAQFSSYVRKQSISAYESLDAGLTIKTKEGDLVRLTSSSFAELDAHSYNSKGILQTESGMAMATQNTREITLTTGESFSFLVVGDLSEEELADIGAIVKGIDEIISEITEGDMDEAVEKALSMGGYDTVSMYAADISYQRSYQMMSDVRAETVTPVLEAEAKPELEPVLQDGNLNQLSTIIPYPENRSPRKKRDNTIEDINKFFEKMVDKLEKYQEKLIDKAQQPIAQLFSHHLDDIQHNKKNHKKGEKQSLYNTVNNVGKQIDKLIDQMQKKMFQNHVSNLFE